MKSTWSINEIEQVKNLLCECRYEDNVSLYQGIGQKHILIAQVCTVCGSELRKLAEMSISTTVFAVSDMLEIWMIKY